MSTTNTKLTFTIQYRQTSDKRASLIWIKLSTHKYLTIKLANSLYNIVFWYQIVMYGLNKSIFVIWLLQNQIWQFPKNRPEYLRSSSCIFISPTLSYRLLEKAWYTLVSIYLLVKFFISNYTKCMNKNCI